MRKRVRKILITGGAGFIGSEFCRQAGQNGYLPIILDKLTYAGDLARLKEIRGGFKFYQQDICHKKQVKRIFVQEKPEIVVHFAGETHVDRSIKDALPFIKTNVQGTQNIISIAASIGIEKFIHISTDEVYGALGKKGQFRESSHLRPSSPYAATKAASDMLAQAWIKTYKFPAVIVRPCNNYGPWQYPEKLIPFAVYMTLKNKKIPVYGKGDNMRQWLHISDCVKAIFLILKKGEMGEVYNIGSDCEKINKDIVETIIKVLNKSMSLIAFVKDRPGHDFRYSSDYSKLKHLSWRPEKRFEKSLIETILWYKKNQNWLDRKAKQLGSYWHKMYEV